ncbi:MAG: ADP-glyceromanno-heptose 6-epimerase [Candidatus Tectimicrobiota bacterium]
MLIITGAAGFIGSNLALQLASLGYELWLVDTPLTPATAANLVGLSHFTFIEQQRFLRVLESPLPACQGVFHLGACQSTAATGWDLLYANNVAYSQALWRWCVRQQCPFLYASSAATYGDGSQGFDDRTPPAQLKPLSLYGQSKNLFDQWLLEEVAAGQPTPPGWAGLKFFNVYGPREAHKGRLASMVWQAYEQMATTGEVRLFQSTDPAYPDGGQQRDFIYVADCIAHLLWLWHHPQVCGLFNSGTGEARTFHEMVLAVCVALGRPPRIRYIDMPAEIRGQYPPCMQANMTSLRRAGYNQPATSLERGVSQLLAAEQARLCRPGGLHAGMKATL